MIKAQAAAAKGGGGGGGGGASQATEKRVGNYLLGRTLGKGAFGKVKAAVHIESGQTVAVKILTKQHIIESAMTDQVKNEITIMRRLNHENIVNMLDVMASKHRVYIVQELVAGGELLYHLAREGKFSERVTIQYYRQLVDGMAYLHEHFVAHRDIKPENMLLTDNGTVKITDFGLAVSVEDGALLYRAAGTPAYLAPEIVRSHGYDGRCADVWSTGVVLFVFLTGTFPWSEPDLLRKIARAELKYPSCLPDGAKDLLKHIFVSDPSKRATMDDIKAHPWFNSDVGSLKRSATRLPYSTAGSHFQIPQKVNVLDLLSISGVFEIECLITRKPPPLTKFIVKTTVDEVIKKMTTVLCTLPLTFTTIESLNQINIQAPFANEMIVIIVHTYSISSNVQLIDFQRLKGDSDEFFLLYREICDKFFPKNKAVQ